MARLNKPIFLVPLLVEPHEVRHEPEHAQDHHQRIVVDVARLHPAHDAGDPADDLPGTVHHGAVDQGLVAALPQARTQCAGTAGDDVLVDPVEVVLVLEQDVDRHAGALDRGRQGRVHHVHVVGERDAGQGQPERRRLQSVQGHRHRAVEHLGQLGHRGVLGGVHEDHVLEEVAEQHRLDGQEADHHRGDGQQHQGHRHHPGRLVRLGVVAMAVTVVVVRVVVVVVRIRVLVVALLAMEDQEVHAERIESGDEHAGQHREVREACGGQRAGVHGLDDAVLGIEAREQRHADQRQGAQQRGDPGDGHVLAHGAHPADVLVVVHAHDHRARPEEQQRLEERVRHQVEHGHRVGGCAQRHRHVTQLRQRGIGHHALDVVLDHAQEAHEQGRDGTDHQDEVEGRIRQLEQRRHARHHEDAGGHHGGRVDQRGDRGRAFHRVGQPHVQRELRALAHRADEQADADHGDEHPVRSREADGAQLARLGEDLAVVQRAGVGGDQADAQDEAEVADAVHEERLHVGEDGRGLVEPEADQQVRNEAHRFPAEEQLQQVVAHDQHEHREREQRDVREEAVVAVVLFHVADGVDMHHQRHEGHHAHHHGGERVDEEADFHLEAAHHHPGVERLVEAGAVERHALERQGREHERDEHAEDREGVARAASDAVAAEGRAEDAGERGARQRRQRHREEHRSGEGLTHS